MSVAVVSSRNRRSWPIVLFSGLSAFVLSVINRDHAMKPAVPLIFLLALVPVGHICGRRICLLVAIIAGLIFAAFLFEPYGSLAIRSAADRFELLGFAIVAVLLVCISPRPLDERKSRVRS